MTSFNLANVSEALQDVSNDNSGISFSGLGKKWETENDGKENKRVCDFTILANAFYLNHSQRFD